MKRNILTLLVALLALSTPLSAQQLTMSIKESVVEVADDLDARVYHAKLDLNDEKCAILKVTPTNELKNPLTLEVGGLGVVDRVEKENGEIWFYLPARVKNLKFSCLGYTTPPAIPVQLKSGCVYRLQLHTDATFQTVHNAVLNATFLKLIINTEGAIVSLGRTAEYEMVCRTLDGQLFSERLNFGTYYYKVEHPLYETATGVIEVKSGLADQHVNLQPAYGYLHITSSPSRAELFVNGKKVGTTPWMGNERYGRGSVELRFQANDYYPLRKEITIVGKGDVEKFHFDLRPQFGTVECLCEDPKAEIWIDEEFKGVGKWTGRVSSLSQHIVEARRTGHQPQSIVAEVKEGESASYRIGAPVALYGALEMLTTPELCQISIDGTDMGTTPTILSLLVGKHTIELSADGYATKKLDIEIAHNQTLALTQELEKATTPKPASKKYAVGDLYDDGTKKGVVFWISPDGKQGKIVSLQEGAKIRWCSPNSTYSKSSVKTDSRTDGAKNMQKVQQIDGWRGMFPAFHWCAALGDGWYLPAKEELVIMCRIKDFLNKAFAKHGAILLKNSIYWSSTEVSDKNAWWVTAISGGVSFEKKIEDYYVRAIAVIEIANTPTSHTSSTSKSTSTSTTTYKVGDIYDDGTKRGVVFEVSPNRQHGKIISLEETKCSWDEAKQWCTNLGQGWRLPTQSELQTISDLRYNIEFKSSLFISNAAPIQNSSYWSGDERDSVYAWRVTGYNGYTNNSSKSNISHVRAVSDF